MRLPTTRKDRALKRKRLEVSLEDELDALRDFADLADYTEAVRKREAEAKAAEPAADKGKGKGKAAARAAPASDEEGNGDSADEDALAYYNAVKASQERRRETREQAVAEGKARAAAAAFSSGDEDGSGASSADDGSGKRLATDTILKNRGLTVKRKKELRNPRVKRRKQYEKAQKKLKSTGVRVATVPQTAYGGESTGIKRNLARSVPLK